MVVKKRTIGVLLAAFIILWLNSGNFDYISDRIPTIAKFGIVGLWLVIACDTDRQFLERYIRISLPIFMVLILLVCSSLIGRSTYSDMYFMRFMYLAVIQALFSFYFYGGYYKEIAFLLLVLFADVGIVAIRTVIIVLQNPIVARAISTSVQMRTELLGDFSTVGVGGYGLCYQLAFITPCIGYVFNEKQQKSITKILVYAMIVFALFQFQITMALLVSVAFIFCFEIIRSNGGSWTIVLAKTATIFAIIVVFVNFQNVIEYISRYANTDLAKRLNELLLIRSDNANSADDLLSRFRLYSISISSFWKNPIWGMFGNGPYGAHSTILDLLASFGILGAFGICGICRPLTILYKNCEKGSRERVYVMWITVAFVLFSVLNVALWSDILLICNFAIPLVFKASGSSIDRISRSYV